MSVRASHRAPSSPTWCRIQRFRYWSSSSPQRDGPFDQPWTGPPFRWRCPAGCCPRSWRPWRGSARAPKLVSNVAPSPTMCCPTSEHLTPVRLRRTPGPRSAMGWSALVATARVSSECRESRRCAVHVPPAPRHSDAPIACAVLIVYDYAVVEPRCRCDVDATFADDRARLGSNQAACVTEPTEGGALRS